MRLNLRSQVTFLQKIQLRAVEWYLGSVPGPIMTMTYKRDYFGKYFAQCLHEAMREMQQWSKAEVELFAAFVSKQNDCDY